MSSYYIDYSLLGEADGIDKVSQLTKKLRK